MKIKDVIIVLLIAVILSLVGYIIYDKVEYNNINTKVDNNKQNKNNTNNTKEDNSITIKKENKEYFDNYLKIFLPSGSANNFKRTINEFSDQDISTYLLFYYSSLANNGEISAVEQNGTYSYDVTKKQLDDVVYKYFGKKEYNLILSDSRTGIRKLENDMYQIFWYATGWTSPEATNIAVNYNGSEVTVEYKLTNDIYGSYGENSKLTFNLLYNDGNYNIKSILYDKLQ